MKNYQLVHTTSVALALVSAACGAACMAACSKTPDPPPAAVGVTTITAAQAISRDDAIVRLGGARCEREVACGNVGPGKKFESAGACVSEMGKRTRTELRFEKAQCSGGISEPRLDDCLLDVKYEQCESPLERVDRFVACRRDKLCRPD